MSLLCCLAMVLLTSASAMGDANSEGERVTLKAGKLAGVLHDNASNAGRDGAGFNPLRYTDYPKSTLYRPDQVGLNFEHIFNGLARDYEPSFFTPRVDRNDQVVHSEQSASIRFAMWNFVTNAYASGWRAGTGPPFIRGLSAILPLA